MIRTQLGLLEKSTTSEVEDGCVVSMLKVLIALKSNLLSAKAIGKTVFIISEPDGTITGLFMSKITAMQHCNQTIRIPIEFSSMVNSVTPELSWVQVRSLETKQTVATIREMALDKAVSRIENSAVFCTT